jgi:hypothetical protein
MSTHEAPVTGFIPNGAPAEPPSGLAARIEHGPVSEPSSTMACASEPSPEVSATATAAPFFYIAPEDSQRAAEARRRRTAHVPPEHEGESTIAGAEASAAPQTVVEALMPGEGEHPGHEDDPRGSLSSRPHEFVYNDGTIAVVPRVAVPVGSPGPAELSRDGPQGLPLDPQSAGDRPVAEGIDPPEDPEGLALWRKAQRLMREHERPATAFDLRAAEERIVERLRTEIRIAVETVRSRHKGRQTIPQDAIDQLAANARDLMREVAADPFLLGSHEKALERKALEIRSCLTATDTPKTVAQRLKDRERKRGQRVRPENPMP